MSEVLAIEVLPSAWDTLLDRTRIQGWIWGASLDDHGRHPDVMPLSLTTALNTTRRAGYVTIGAIREALLTNAEMKGVGARSRSLLHRILDIPEQCPQCGGPLR